VRAADAEILMTKKRKAVRRTKSRRAPSRRAAKPAKRRKRQHLEFARSSLTIRFKTESELRERLAGLMTLFDDAGSTTESLEAAGAVDSCLSLIQSVQIVAKALAPRTFTPTEKLGDTYLASQERELFKARVVKGVTAAGCRIGDTNVPAEATTTHSAVAGAIRQNAHG
jgi:hypothetical protein